MARAPVSKTGGWGFESLHSCQFQTTEDGGRRTEDGGRRTGVTALCRDNSPLSVLRPPSSVLRSLDAAAGRQ